MGLKFNVATPAIPDGADGRIEVEAVTDGVVILVFDADRDGDEPRRYFFQHQHLVRLVGIAFAVGGRPSIDNLGLMLGGYP